MPADQMFPSSQKCFEHKMTLNFWKKCPIKQFSYKSANRLFHCCKVKRFVSLGLACFLRQPQVARLGTAVYGCIFSPPEVSVCM